jgi:hypothetical protein
MQLYWASCYKPSYRRHRAWVCDLQRLRWLVTVACIYATSTSQDLLHPMQWRTDGGEGSWQHLAAFLGFFTFPAMFTAIVVHPVAFRVQLLLLLPLYVLQHYIYALPHQLYALDGLGLRGLAARGCTVLSALVDPTAVLVQGPSLAAPQCAEERPSFFLMYTYILVAGILPTQMVYWSEQWHKLAFLRGRHAQGSLMGDGGDGLRFWEQPGSTVQAGRSALTAIMHFWGAASICWSLLTFAYALAPLAAPLLPAGVVAAVAAQG